MRTEDKRSDKTRNTHTQKKGSKITPIRFPYNESDDPVIDEFILRGLQEEADEEERRVNSDPELSKITAPDDQYDKIVARLKAMGLWQDEESRASAQDDADTEKEEKPEMLPQEGMGRAESGAQEETAGMEEETPAQYETIDSRSIAQLETAETENGISKQYETTAPQTQARCGTREKSAAENVPGAAAEVDMENACPDVESLYQMLSEEDREAMELGRRERERQRRKKKRVGRLTRILKRGTVTAAALVLVFGVSMRVDASRRLILKMWDSVVDGLVARTATNNVEEENVISATIKESIAAMEAIEEATGIPGLDFGYWPDGMEYLRYEIHDDGTEAFIFYSYGEEIIHLYMRNADSESLNYYLTDGNALLKEIVDNWMGNEVEIWEVNPEQGEGQYRAEFAYENYRYMIYGYMPLEELEKIVKYINFLIYSL